MTLAAAAIAPGFNLLATIPTYVLTQRGSVLTASDAAASDNFGNAVAVSSNGNVMAVAARFWEGASGVNRGGIYIYDRNGTSWTQRGSVLSAADGINDEAFGGSVALSADGEVLVVGSNGRDSNAKADSGGVYVYDRNGTGWTLRGSVLVPADSAAGDQFGVSVALSADGTVLAVGAHRWENTGTDRGGVYIFDRNGTGWTQRGSVLEASDAADNDTFGVAVAFSADASVLAVGAYGWEGATGTDRGVVYVYDRNGTSWTQRGSPLEAFDAADSDQFGFSLSFSSDASIMAVGALAWEGDTGTNRGGVYLFNRSGTGWIRNGNVLEAADAADSDAFARGVALTATADTLVVGARDWEGGAADQGGVYVYDIA